MDRTTFWKIVEECRNESDDIEDFGDVLTGRLEKIERDEIESFASEALYPKLCEKYFA